MQIKNRLGQVGALKEEDALKTESSGNEDDKVPVNKLLGLNR